MSLTLLAHDIRSTHNVGAFFRTCDGFGIDRILFSGYTPYPTFEGDTRLPHFADKITRQIHKTALGAESLVEFSCFETIQEALATLKSENSVIIALEQFPGSLTPRECAQTILREHPDQPVALLVGNEVHGVNDESLKTVDYIMEIPMIGTKESFNVSVATAIALYELTTS